MSMEVPYLSSAGAKLSRQFRSLPANIGWPSGFVLPDCELVRSLACLQPSCWSWWCEFLDFDSDRFISSNFPRGTKGDSMKRWMFAGALALGPAFAQSQTQAQSKPPMAEQAFKNIQVLKGIPVDEFMGTMGLFSAALTVCCGDCHTGAGT